MFKLPAFLFLLIVSVANCQFFYNYEEDRPEELQPETQNYDRSMYQYNPPSAVNQQYLQQPNSEPQPINESGNRRTRIRVRSRNYQSEPDYNEPQQFQRASAADSDANQRAIRQERRQARRRQRQNDYVTEPPRIYGPSVFQNIGLGEAPSGVYIPQDSFLNVLRNPSETLVDSRLIPQPVTLPQTTDYVQPSVDNTNNRGQSEFFVQPPSDEEQRQPVLILPATRPSVEYANAPVLQERTVLIRDSPAVQARSITGRRRTRPRIRLQPEYAAPPTVDIDVIRGARQDVMPQVQYAPVTISAPVASRSNNRRRAVRNYQESTPAPRVYSPSIFEKVGLGEAPNGIYVPEDSLLNTLRNPSGQHSSRRVSQERPELSAPQPAYSIPNEYEEVAEEQYQPPPPPPPPRRRSSQRSRPTVPSRNQRYRNEYEEYQNIQPIQPSSQRQSQRRGDDFEDFERQEPPMRHRMQTQRRPASASRTQPQSSTPETSQSTFRKANLAIAELPEDTDDDGIPGEAGANYPTLHVIPKTSFSCSQQPHNGYYADLETSCQVVHLCQAGGVQNSFLCPNGTIFSQEKFSCQWWYKVNCNDAPRFYIKNDELYKVPEKKERKRN